MYLGRFAVSLTWCKSFLVLDSKLQVVPEVLDIGVAEEGKIDSRQLTALETSQTQLEDLRTSLDDAEKPLPQMVSCCKTLDQVRVFCWFQKIFSINSSNFQCFSFVA